MEITTLHTIAKSTLDYDPSVPCIIARQWGFLDSSEFREWLNKGLELMIEKEKVHGKMAWFADLRQGDAQADADLQWVATDWTTRALAASIRHVAFILPEDDYALAQMNAETYAELSESKAKEEHMITRMFKDEASAKTWLRDALFRP
ncbi:hypothetical protein LVD17_15035 [Fulvivirga ulvae]|uniref:hypothetical protein n=1 Tax=Fulvivirga ulvae TaxID=2904245 RepID=UPI001F43BBFA|nr:hypothetical protein [Fulvivirga ulvae]UII29613.1 hypothetical protein LVD17_15035 [Fulvivirga ulvae]